MPTLSPAQLTEARGWLADCGFPNARKISETTVISLVDRNYAGGTDAFAADTKALNAPTWGGTRPTGDYAG